MSNTTDKLEQLRTSLLNIDLQIIDLLNSRAILSKKISVVKFNTKLEIRQNNYWAIASKIREDKIKQTYLNLELSRQIFDLIHQQSIAIQEDSIKQLKHEQ